MGGKSSEGQRVITPGHSILIYGDSGIGKSTDVANAFRKAAWILTEPGGLDPATRCLEYEPHPVYELFDVKQPEKEFNTLLNSTIIPKAESGEIRVVVLDTASEIADRIITSWIDKGMDTRQAYGKIVGEVLTPIRRLISLTPQGVWFICICHEIGPEKEEKTGNLLRGGPLMPGKRLPRQLPPKFNLVLRAAVSSDIGEETRVYRCNPTDPHFIMKDREGVVPREMPMELAPIVFRLLHPGQEPPEGLFTKQLRHYY